MRLHRFAPLAALSFAFVLAFTACAQGSSSSDADSGGGKHAVGLRVKLELLQKLGSDAMHVDVEADGGEVVLGGEVKKRATAELAEEVARKVDGVRSVKNDIKVAGQEGAGGVDRALAETEHELSDAALETRVRIALVDKMGTDGFRIGTDAASGTLTLEFPKKMSRARRNEAMKIAKTVEGVEKVVPLEKD